MERTLRRHKCKGHPKKPVTLSDVITAYENQSFMLNYGLNLRKTERFYINTVQGESFAFTLFASYQVIKMIESHIPPENRHYSMDGTFAVTPLKCFYQLLIIHIEYGKSVSFNFIWLYGWLDRWLDGCFHTILILYYYFVIQVFPVFYVLMTGKTADEYMAVLKYIEDYIFKLKPAKFMADFESGIRKAIRDFYPNVALHGCWYHYCAAIRRKILKLGLYDLIKCDTNARSIYKKFLSLPLLPSNKIIEGLELIVQETRNVRLQKEFSPFLRYFKSFWLKLVCYHYFIALIDTITQIYFSIHPSIHSSSHHSTRRIPSR